MKSILKKPYIKIKRILFSIIIKRKAKIIKGKIYINGYSKVNDNTILGNNVHFNGLKVYGRGKIEIGDNFHSGFGCEFITDFHNYDTGTKIPYDETYLIKDITIEDNVWLGSRVMILGGITIGEGSIIQAGSVVVTNIPKYSIAGGHPAKVFKQRNIHHYEELKRLKQFC